MVTTQITIWIGPGYSYWQKVLEWLKGMVGR